MSDSQSTNDRTHSAALQILAGLVSNPSIIAPCPNAGWGLVNCTPAQLANYAWHLARQLEHAGQCDEEPAT